jgi:hypothetical protein
LYGHLVKIPKRAAKATKNNKIPPIITIYLIVGLIYLDYIDTLYALAIEIVC